MSFESIRGQERALEFLRSVLRNGRVPSAFLFHGPHHLGKRSAALAFAMALNCTGPGEQGQPRLRGCLVCPSCRKISEELHPDVETVSPKGRDIRIDQIREVQETLGLIPFEARKRVIVVSQAERMNLQAANAFLKTLEEPPGDTLIILCAENPGRLLETIRSRCLPVRFSLLGEQTLRELLAVNEGLEGPALEFAVRFSQGRVRPELCSRAAHLMQVRDEMTLAMDGLQRPMFGQVSASFARWAGSDDWRFVLEWLESWFRDLALLGQGASRESLVNSDKQEFLDRAVRRFTPAAARRCHRRVLDTREAMVAWNANKALALESLWLGFRELA
ncbi:MAG: DNA polymerase III subunit delta' [Deltaproteobacteria bacterium]|nr:DNA polymerase III subunit delta' [Deltaproteobacteria bacterium]